MDHTPSMRASERSYGHHHPHTAQPPLQIPDADPFQNSRDPFLPPSHQRRGSLGLPPRAWQPQGTSMEFSESLLYSTESAPAKHQEMAEAADISEPKSWWLTRKKLVAHARTGTCFRACMQERTRFRYTLTLCHFAVPRNPHPSARRHAHRLPHSPVTLLRWHLAPPPPAPSLRPSTYSRRGCRGLQGVVAATACAMVVVVMRDAAKRNWARRLGSFLALHIPAAALARIGRWSFGSSRARRSANPSTFPH